MKTLNVKFTRALNNETRVYIGYTNQPTYQLSQPAFGIAPLLVL